jgi:hypothetical protein
MVGACSVLPSVDLPASPTPCAMTYSEDRCDAIAVVAAKELGVEVADVARLDILPPPTPERGPDGEVLQTLSGGPSPEIGVILADGSSLRFMLHCGGIASGYVPACMDEPRLQPSSATLGGYRDVPCAGEPPDGCATPQPAIEPGALAAAAPLVIDALDIAIDGVGPHEIPIGTGSLPNGILSEAAFQLVDPWPDGLVILEGRVFLDVRSLESDGVPFHNYYEHGWREGVEDIEAVLIFTVDHVEPGAVLRIADVIVR